MKKIIILLLSLLGILISLILVYNNFIVDDYCPKIFTIPACYLVLSAFILIFISNFFKKNISNILFWVGNIFEFALAVYFSVNNILALSYCPLFINIPLCFVSFFSFLLLPILKITLKDKK